MLMGGDAQGNAALCRTTLWQNPEPFNLKTSVGTVARMTKVLKMGEKIAKYSAAVAYRYGEDRFRDFFAQIRRIRRSQ